MIDGGRKDLTVDKDALDEFATEKAISDDAHQLMRAYSLRNAMGLLTVEDISALLGITRFALQQWRFFGQGPKYVKLGRGIYYRINDVREWIDSNVLEPATVKPKNKKVA